MEYKYLYKNLSDGKRSGLEALSEKEQNAQLKKLQEEWDKTDYTRLLEESKAAVNAAKKNEPDAFHTFRNKLRWALINAQSENYIVHILRGGKQELSKYESTMLCLSDVLASLDEDEKQELASKKYRGFIAGAQKYEDLENASLAKLIFWPVFFLLFWIGVYKLFSAPFMADVLCLGIWDSLVYIVFMIIVFGVIFSCIGSGTGCLLAFIIGIVGVSIIVFIAQYAAIWIISLIPAIHANFENAGALTAILFVVILFILCIITIIGLLLTFSTHCKAIGKEAKKRAQLSGLQKDAKSLEEERNLYGLIVEAAVLCEADARWEQGLQEKAQKIASVREFFKELCDGYDNTKKVADNNGKH